MERIAIYPGSFDPVTNGHLDVAQRASGLFDKVIISIATNSSKKALFTVEKRIELLKESCQDIPNVEIASFDGLLVDAVHHFNASCVVRGLRAVSDFEWEFQMALMNRELDSACETIFLMPRPKFSFVSSTMIKELAKYNGDVSSFVPSNVIRELKKEMID